MGGLRKNSLSSQHGIALITALIIALSGVALVGGIYYLLRGGLKIVVLNREFKSAQEAASGSIEYGVALVKYSIQYEGNLPDDIKNELGIGSSIDLSHLHQCDPSQAVILSLKAPGDQYNRGTYQIRLTISCQNYHLIPGGSESLKFPPPPTGTGGNKSYYVFYRIHALVKGGDTVADVESLYRASM